MYNKIQSIIVFICCIGLSFADYLSLDGNEWNAITIKTKAVVPGSIYSDLRTNGILKGLYIESNDVNYRWVSYDNWTYERTFNVDSSLLSKESVHLVANGIDTVSSVYINDKLIGKTDNMFVRYKFDVKDVLKTGENTMRVVFQSAVLYALKQSEDYKTKYGYDVIPDCMSKEYNGECHFNFVRKMASSFSWDWGPAFPTQGIWKSIGIEAYDRAIVRDITVETNPNPDYTEWTLTLTTHLESASYKQLNGIFSIQLDENTLIDSQTEILVPKTDGTVSVKFVIPVKNIKIIPWYPNGVADNTQKLYDLRVKLSFADSEEVSKQSKRIGFRKIQLIQTPLTGDALTFYFEVNSKPFFAKGSNWIPANVLSEDISREYLRHLLESAKEANMNMMRVWGGGVYESDYFYELADEFGIMLWQDFMFACALYPTNPDYLKSVDAEVLTQVRRIQHHPSIAIWAGNNENEGWVYQGSNVTIHKTDYVELYINHIRKLLLQEDNTRPFVGSSPSNGDEEKKENWTAKNSQDKRYGDVHYYNYDAKLWDWKIFPSGKFTSEYGYMSYPSLQTMADVLEETDLTFPISAAIEHRQHHPGGTKSIEKEISYYMKLPTNGGNERLNDLIYLSQVFQANAIRIETEFYRRNREYDSKTGNGYTMGALYWQLDDIWQGPTWASIEFGGKWKLLQSYAIDFLKNQLISPFEDNNNLKISFIRDDYLGELTFDLTIKVFKWSSLKPVKEITSQVKTNSFSVNNVYNHSIADLLKESNCVDRSECVLSVDITNTEQKLEAHNFFLFSEPKNSKIVKPNLKLVDVKKSSNLVNNKQVFEIELSSEAIAPFVLLDFKLNSGITGYFPENGFFVFNETKSVIFKTNSDLTVEQIRDSLTFKTLTDVM